MFEGRKLSGKLIRRMAGNKIFFPYNIETRNVVTSTNTIMKKEASDGKEEFSVLIASSQSEGRGRMGRSFHSPGKTGVYMSILLRPDKKENPLHITTDAAVCCARVFEKLTGERAEIKWVNDIYMRGRKVCGILTESSLSDNGYAVLGIGVNVTMPKKGFPDDIKDRAGAVFSRNSKHLREKVASELLCEFLKIYSGWNRTALLEEYKERSMLKGKEILILKGDKTEIATAIDVADDYSLIVKKENGETEKLNSGDVTIKMGM